MFSLIFAWSWMGHGQLTALGLALAISQLVPLGKQFVLRRLSQFAAVKSAIERQVFGAPGFPPTENQVKAYLEQLEHHSPSTMEQTLIRLFDDLPSRVQEEDIHLGNIPTIGEYLEKDSQVRHYMRSHKTTPAREAHIKSRNYIWNHLFWSWSSMRNAVYHQHKWYDFLYDSTMSDFDDGVQHLAKALHSIEDSYAPGHVQRQQGTGIIEDVHYWDDENKRPDPSRNWPGHEALDNPSTTMSRPFYDMARRAAGSFILCTIANLDQDRATYVRDCGNQWYGHFTSSF